MTLNEAFDWLFSRICSNTPRFDKDMKALNIVKAALNCLEEIDRAFTEEEYPEYFEMRAELQLDALHQLIKDINA